MARDAPLGERAVVLDDGTLILEGVSLRVRDLTVPPEAVCGCGAAPATGALSVLVGLLGLVRRVRLGAQESQESSSKRSAERPGVNQPMPMDTTSVSAGLLRA